MTPTSVSSLSVTRMFRSRSSDMAGLIRSQAGEWNRDEGNQRWDV